MTKWMTLLRSETSIRRLAFMQACVSSLLYIFIVFSIKLHWHSVENMHDAVIEMYAVEKKFCQALLL